MKEKRNNKKTGITLVALVVTIVIMLILASVTIGAINGGLFDYAGNAKTETENVEEIKSLKQALMLSREKNKTGKDDQSNFQKIINNIIGENNCMVYDLGDTFRVHFNNSDNWYVIDNDGNVETWTAEKEPNGIYVATSKISKLTLDGAILLSPVSAEIPSTKDNLDYIWASSNPEVAEISADGILKCGNTIGTTIITCKGANNKQATCEVTTTAKIMWSNNDSNNKTVDGNSASSMNPTIPTGYSAIDTKDASWNLYGAQTDIDNGLVIMDNNGNQFVWVPVPNVIYDETTEITSGTYTPMAVLKSGSQINYQGIFYAWEEANMTSWYVSGNSSQVEPASAAAADFTADDENRGYALIRKYTSGMEGKTDDEVKAAWNKQMQTEYNAMVNSVAKHGGYWLSRYNVSYDVNKKRVASIAGARVGTANLENLKTWYSLYQKAKDYSKNANQISGMIWGSQYDAMINWMARNGLSVGSASPILAGTARNTSQITGKPNVNDKLKNIFDLQGYTKVWTQAAYKGFNRMGRMVRGPSPVSGSDGNAPPQNESAGHSSRITLNVN